MNLLDNTFMLFRFTNDTAFSYLAFSHLELGLNENNHPAAVHEQRWQDRDYLGYRDERYIDHDQVEKRIKIINFQASGIRFFPYLDARVFTQLPNELIGPRIDSHDPFGSTLQ